MPRSSTRWGIRFYWDIGLAAYGRRIEQARVGEIAALAIFLSVVAGVVAVNVFFWIAADPRPDRAGWVLHKLLLCTPLFTAAVSVWGVVAFRLREGSEIDRRVRTWVTADGEAVLRAPPSTPLARAAQALAFLSFVAGVALYWAYRRAPLPAAGIAWVLVLAGSFGMYRRVCARLAAGWYDWRYVPARGCLFPAGMRPAIAREDIAAVEIVAVTQPHSRRPVLWYAEYYQADFDVILRSGERLRVLRTHSEKEMGEALAELERPKRFFAEHLGLEAA